MRRSIMSDNKKFNKTAYNNAYNKQHYANCNLRLKAENARIIADFANKLGISKAALIQKCVQYCYKNNVDISNTDI